MRFFPVLIVLVILPIRSILAADGSPLPLQTFDDFSVLENRKTGGHSSTSITVDGSEKCLRFIADPGKIADITLSLAPALAEGESGILDVDFRCSKSSSSLGIYLYGGSPEDSVAIVLLRKINPDLVHLVYYTKVNSSRPISLQEDESRGGPPPHPGSTLGEWCHLRLKLQRQGETDDLRVHATVYNSQTQFERAAIILEADYVFVGQEAPSQISQLGLRFCSPNANGTVDVDNLALYREGTEPAFLNVQ